MSTTDYIHPIKLGVSFGIIWSISVFIISFIFDKIPLIIFTMIKQVYPGCNNNSIINRIICLLFGFIDAFTGGYLIAFIYNNI